MAGIIAEEFYSYLSLQRRFSPLTVEAYRRDLLQFSVSVPDITVPGDVTLSHVRGFVASLMEAGMSPVTVNRKISALRSYFRFLLKTGKIAVNPCQHLVGPKKPRPLPTFIDEKQLGTSFSPVEHDGYESARDAMIIEMFYNTGMRRAELIGLRESDVDLHNLQVRVTGKRSKERIIPFGIQLKRSLETYLTVKKAAELHNERLFVSSKDRAISPGLVSTIVTTALSSMTTAKKKSPHVLRHTFATHMLNNGADINALKELLGHASLAATQVYTHNSIEKLKKLYKQAHPRSGH